MSAANRRVLRHVVVQPHGPYRIIPLTKGQNAIVDAENFEWLSQWNWYANWKESTHSFHAVRLRDGGGGLLSMHRAILNCAPDEEADHWNHDTLDNRRANLRKCTHLQNQHNLWMGATNTSGYKGISWDKSRNLWKSEIRADGKRLHLGRFATKEEAARAYDTAARELHGEFALLNFKGETAHEFTAV